MMRAFGGSRCEDCGNQAKRDCGYKRCRTCCKRKGFQCQTHIKSTWLNPSNNGRSQNQNQTQTLLLHHDLSSSPTCVYQHNPKRLRLNPTGFDEEEIGRNLRSPEPSFPAMVRCTRVSSGDYAYHTSVSIGGHVFKGILHDHGLDSPTPDHFFAEPHQPNLSHALTAPSSSSFPLPGNTHFPSLD